MVAARSPAGLFRQSLLMANGKLTTHVLDTATGRPAAGLTITLHRPADDAPLHQLVTNDDGRAPAPLLEGDALQPGTYELRFAVGDYFAQTDHPDAHRFLGVVPIVFCVDDPEAHYHVPLLVSPWSYSTYRGS